MFVRKLSMCSPDVKVSLFRTFCTPMYTAQLWCNYYAYSVNKLRIAYNGITKMLLGLPRCHSTSQMVANVNVPACQAVIRNLIFKFMCRLDKSENHIIQGLVCPSVSDAKYTSKTWIHWYKQLHIHYLNG